MFHLLRTFNGESLSHTETEKADFGPSMTVDAQVGSPDLMTTLTAGPCSPHKITGTERALGPRAAVKDNVDMRVISSAW